MKRDISTDIVVEDINESNLRDIPEPCCDCVYWEFPEEFERAKEDPNKESEFEAKKKEWFKQTLKEFGTCGKIVYHKGKPIAYAQYAPSTRLPNIGAYESKPVGKSEDGVVFLSCLYITDGKLRGKGIGERLLESVIEELKRRGFKAVETYARRNEAENPSGSMKFYIRNGFHIKDKTDAEYPLMRRYL